ncbi:speriolin-like protein isoform 1-T1 [Anomaloglossus baeobatrachus]|uniref:speriolin-like protein isoform X1 n=1 Tax=Anomaloglossus baeobatrachus TaxID=238106 RepID=UPI003F4F8AB7
MFSGASTNYNMDNPGLYSSDEEAFNTESLRLLKENAKLRKLMGLMQENVELRCTLKEHERKAQIITPPGQHKKDHNGMKEKKNTEISQHHYLREEAQMVNSGPHLDLENIKKCQRIVGELAFQLDRRILSAIFLEQQRMYGYRVPNIKEKIIQVTTIPATGKVDEKLRYELYQRYNHTMDELRKFGYNPTVHPHFTEYIVNTYGVTKDRHAKTEDLSSYNDPQYLKKMINECMPRDIVENIIIILNCLVYFAREDGKSLLI